VVLLRHLVLAAVAPIVVSAAALAQGAGPFAEFEGRWNGSGTITHGDGRSERLRCTANANARGDQLQNQLTCRSDSSNFQFVATVRSEGGRIAGQWSETINNVTGTIEGRLSGGNLQAQAQGQGFNAALTMTARSGRQTVSIRAAAKELSTVNITLARGK
jgi:hypothetical protein